MTSRSAAHRWPGHPAPVGRGSSDHWRSARQHGSFDVTSDGVLLLEAYEPPRAATATRRVTVRVSGGTLRLSFLPGAGRNNLDPIVNGIRLTHRPDLG